MPGNGREKEEFAIYITEESFLLGNGNFLGRKKKAPAETRDENHRVTKTWV